ncbi:thioredoxin family protein [Desulforamulus hydrothermalis]|uniref:Thioredoxin domain-containing protein n=1 Tax=Desulforamulus hydrothermalis Lam5 = DSM 18033 TaxID=1121428 RepID=K8DZ25_9FIRM|nr:thioredoxin family protein [Desulforamulus hydrothermalis]CCO08130.1 Thioredoxin domain-containing protein [Desulforamulus hydrothermalis Lam5 = DSM 18033]SHG81332.1 thioredoxin 1 [Desulforamulus hydrothermalis Lam5 = DSM 18033]
MSLQQLNANDFEEIIYDNGEPCLVVFSRKNCHVCKEVVPMLEELSAKYEGKFGFYSVDVEEEKNLIQRFSLRGVPQIIFFNDGQLQGKLSGSVEEEDVEEKIAEIIG